MTNEEMTNEYIKRNPGDLITSEDWNEAQGLIKEDIADQVGRVEADLNEFKEEPVDAEKFGGNTPEEWTKEFDDRFVNHAELGAGWGEYRRYFKQIDRQLADDSFEPAIIKHNLHRYPVVNIYELAKLEYTPGFLKREVVRSTEDNNLGHMRKNEDIIESLKREVVTDNDGNEVKFLVYYAGHRDPVAEKLMTKGEDDVHWGDPLNLILEQFGISPNSKQYFDDVLNDLWGHMFDPGLSQDHFKRESYGHSEYIQTEILDKDRTVEKLRESGIWDDLRMAIRPQMIIVSSPYVRRSAATPDSGSTVGDGRTDAVIPSSGSAVDDGRTDAVIPSSGSAVDDGRTGPVPPDSVHTLDAADAKSYLASKKKTTEFVQMFHLSQDILEIRVPSAMDLMILLRT